MSSSWIFDFAKPDKSPVRFPAGFHFGDNQALSVQFEANPFGLIEEEREGSFRQNGFAIFLRRFALPFFERIDC